MRVLFKLSVDYTFFFTRFTLGHYGNARLFPFRGEPLLFVCGWLAVVSLAGSIGPRRPASFAQGPMNVKWEVSTR